MQILETWAVKNEMEDYHWIYWHSLGDFAGVFGSVNSQLVYRLKKWC